MQNLPMVDTALSYQAGISIMVVYLINFLKSSKLFPLLTQETARLNTLASAVLAFLATAGVSTAIHGSWTQGFQIAITIPSLGSLMDFVVHYAAQFGMQQAFYHQIKGENGKA